MIDLIVKAKHFKRTDFSENCNCALAKAAKEMFHTENVNEAVNYMSVDEIDYSHPAYTVYDFNIDEVKAHFLKYSDEVIRAIQLTPIT